MATTSVLLGSSMGLELVSGLFNMGAADSQAEALKSQASLVRSETTAEIERYKISATRFKASQKMSYIKSGVQLEGSPLDVLDETARTASENISAIRAQGEAEAAKLKAQARGVRAQGREALVGGLTTALGLYAAYGAGAGSGSGTVAKKGPTTSSSSGSKMSSTRGSLNLYNSPTGLAQRIGF